MATDDVAKIKAWIEENSEKLAITIGHYLKDKTTPVKIPVIKLGRVVHQPKKHEIAAAGDWMYTGYRDEKNLCVVRRKNTARTAYGRRKGGSQRLSVRQDVYNHGNGFEWGYAGSGPAQLALAMLVQYLESEIGDKQWKEKAIRWHQDFKFRYIAPLPREERWFITKDTLNEFIREMENKEYGTSSE